ncbi:MAG: glycosyltransferase family 4 protein [Terrimicrobiaceae bacterium]|nr:glycosyltransferase family 4 protein [Terrimicrobiaceae bacterium]
MKILTLCYEYPPVGGGGGRMAHNVASALVRRGHNVRVQTIRMTDLPAREVRDGVEIFRAHGFRRRADLCTVPEMFAYVATSFFPALGHIRRWKPDIVHAHFAVPTGALAFACKGLTGIPYVLTAHLGDLPGGNPDQTDGLFRIMNPLIRPIWKNAAGISASSSFAAGLAREAYGVEPRIILNGISMKGKPAGARPPASPLELAAIGRFNPQKNFPWLIRTLGGCDFPWRLSLIGDGSQREEIEAAIRDVGDGDRVNLMGWVAESSMRDVLARSDVLLMPSTSEGNPVAAIEALKHGVAILGSDIGGLSDLIENGKNGFAVSIETPAIFQEKLAVLASHPDILHKMKTQSLELATRFDLENIATDFESLLLDSSRRRR